jgi:uncharacterized membrane protein YhhN
MGNRFAAVVLSAITAILVACALEPVLRGSGGTRIEFLYGASTGFLLVGLAVGGGRWGYGRLLLAGLVCCWVGDVVGPRHFEAGAIAFAVAHVCFGAAFLHRGIRPKRLLMALIPVVIGGGAVLSWIAPHLEPGEGLLVAAYTLVISGMLALALAMPPSRSARLAQLAALIFYVSDLFVARWRYVDSGAENALYCYPLYYAACLLFAWNATNTRDTPTDA